MASWEVLPVKWSFQSWYWGGGGGGLISRREFAAMSISIFSPLPNGFQACDSCTTHAAPMAEVKGAGALEPDAWLHFPAVPLTTA